MSRPRGPEADSGVSFFERSTGSRRRLLAVGLASFLSVAAVATTLLLFFLLRQARENELRDWSERLASAALVRREMVDDWFEERRADSRLFARFPSLRESVAPRDRAGLALHLQDVLRAYEREHADVSLALFYADGRTPVVTAEGAPDADLERIARATMKAGAAGFEIAAPTDGGVLRFVFAEPLFAPGAAASAAPDGALLLVARPAQILFPRLLRPPFATRTGETLLARDEGSTIRILSPVRYAPATARSFLSVPRADQLAVGEVLAGRPVSPGARDYRGVEVLAAGERLRSAPWAIVVKVDRSEAMAGFVRQRNALLAAGLGAAGALVAAALLLLAGVQRGEAAETARHERALRLRLERERRLLEVVYALDEAIVHEGDRERLLALVCRILVDEAGFRVAVVLRADRELGEFRIAAFQGPFEPVVDRIGLRFDDSPSGRFAPGLAFRERRTIVLGDLETAPEAELHRDVIRRLGHRSGMFLPLAVGEEGWGVLVILDDEADVFVPRTVDLLQRAAASLSHALTSIADRRRRDAAERERERLVAALEQADEAVLVTDAAANIEFVNPAFERVTGYSRDEVLGRNPRLLKSGAQDAGFYDRLWSTLAAGATWRGRMINRRKDGSTFEEEATISPVRDASGAVTNYVAVKRDLSRELALERDLARAQKLEAVGRLAGGIAHDYNNMLAVVLGYAEILEATLPADHEAQDSVREIRSAAERATALTRQLLHFGRHMPSQAARFDVNEALRRLVGLLRPLLGEDIDIVLRLAPLPLEVEIDPALFDQAIVNLAVNARDAMPGGGRLTLATRPLAAEDGGPADRGWLRLTVEDDGTGMDDATRERLFEPFFTTKRPGKGTGLGLSTVYGHVRQWGGRIDVDSAPGRGSRFDLDLPLAAGGATPRAANPEPPPAAPPATVLLAEDQDELRRFLRAALEQIGMTVIDAANGEAALALAAQDGRAIDLLVSDLVMPRLGGAELARALRARWPAMRVLFISGYPPERFDSDAATAGAPLLQKPFTREALAHAVALALAGSVPDDAIRGASRDPEDPASRTE